MALLSAAKNKEVQTEIINQASNNLSSGDLLFVISIICLGVLCFLLIWFIIESIMLIQEKRELIKKKKNELISKEKKHE